MPRTFPLVLLVLLSGIVLDAGCVGTAVPQPPNQDPINPTDLEGRPEAVEANFVEYLGMAGAVPPGAQVWLANLDNMDAQEVALADSAGAFRVSAGAEDGDVVRLSYRTDTGHSQPLDLVSPGTVAVERPACLELALDISLGASRSHVLVFDNRCTEDVRLSDFAFRRGTPALQADAPTSVVLRPDSRFELPLSAAGTDPLEDHLFVFATVLGSTVRYPVSVHVP